jgi:hypothetical protein
MMPVTTDVVGGLQALAENWVIANREEEEIRQRMGDLERDRSAATRRKEEAAKLLVERVGRNITTRVFHIGNEVLIVEHERGIRLVPVEQAP